MFMNAIVYVALAMVRQCTIVLPAQEVVILNQMVHAYAKVGIMLVIIIVLEVVPIMMKLTGKIKVAKINHKIASNGLLKLYALLVLLVI